MILKPQRTSKECAFLIQHKRQYGKNKGKILNETIVRYRVPRDPTPSFIHPIKVRR